MPHSLANYSPSTDVFPSPGSRALPSPPNHVCLKLPKLASSTFPSDSLPPGFSPDSSGSFPNEILFMFFDQLQLMDAKGTISACALVCKSWLPLVRKVLYERPGEPLPLSFYPSEKRNEVRGKFGDDRFLSLVEAFKSRTLGPLVKTLDMDVRMMHCEENATIDDGIRELSSFLPHLPNCSHLDLRGLEYGRLAALFLTISNVAVGPIKRLSLLFHIREGPATYDLTFINIPGYIALRGHSKSKIVLDNLSHLKLRQYSVISADESKWENLPMAERLIVEFVPPKWSLVSCEMIRCYINDKEFPIFFGRPRGKLQHLRIQRPLPSFSAKTLLSIVRSHTPVGGLTSLALVKCVFKDSDDPETSTVAEEIIKHSSASLLHLDLEGPLYVSDQFLTSIIPPNLISLRIIPFDRSLSIKRYRKRIRGKGRIFPAGFAPIDWHAYLQSYRSLFLRTLIIGRSQRWTTDEIKSLEAYGNPPACERANISDVQVVGPLNCRANFGDRWEGATEDEEDDKEVAEEGT